MMTINEITEAIIGSAIEVHRELGPGLLESAYRQCLCHELTLRGMPFVCERPLPVVYKGLRLDCGYRVDLVVADAVVVELKTVTAWRRFMMRNFLLTCGWVVGKWGCLSTSMSSCCVMAFTGAFSGWKRSNRLRQ